LLSDLYRASVDNFAVCPYRQQEGAMDDITKLKITTVHIRNEVDAMSAESLAVQAIVLCLPGCLNARVPGFREATLEVFDDAAEMLKRISSGKDERVAQIPMALNVIKKLVSGDRRREQGGRTASLRFQGRPHRAF
jgi:hypothetical protein